MDKAQTLEAIKVMQAFAEGKEIERVFLCSPGGPWPTDSAPYWNWSANQYRIKAQPVEYWSTLYEDNTLAGFCYRLRSSAEEAAKHLRNGRVVLLREVTTEWNTK